MWIRLETVYFTETENFLLKVCRKKLKTDFLINGTHLTVQWDPL